MSYIGNQPFTAAFLTDTFSGTGSQTAFTMTVAPANTSSIIVAITGVLQDPSTYSVSGTTLTFSAAPPSGTSNISVRYLGIPASGVTTTAYRTVTNTTATAGQTSFTIPSYTVGYVDVYRNGVYLPTSDYTATTGTTVVLTNAATAGDTITTISFYVSSVLNALPSTGGTLTGNLVVTGTETVPTITSPASTALTLQTNNGTTAITVSTSQNVGIGTTSPSGKLDVRGASYFGTPNTFIIGDDGGTDGAFLNQTASLPIRFYTSGTERMRLNNGGTLIINATSVASGVNSTALYANGSIGAQLTYGPMYISNENNTDNVGRASFQFKRGGTEVGSVTTSNSTTSYNTSSDYRLKENIAPMTGALTKVAQLKPVTYKWKSTGTDGQGFIAHELQEVVPDCVHGTKDAVDENGNPKYQAVDTSFLVATLTAAIQELKAELDELKAKVG